MLLAKETFRVNNQIRIRQVRLIDENGVQIGIIDTDEARRLALDRGYDLVEVAADARPPVCKLMDFGKYKYQLKKKERKAKKKQHVQKIKELRLRPMTDDHDLGIKIQHAREFLSRGDKVLIHMRFRGREMAHVDLGKAMMQRVVTELSDISKMEGYLHMEGNTLSLGLMPK